MASLVLLMLVSTVALVSGDDDGLYLNDWDEPVNFQCKANNILNLLYSVHANQYEDRRWETGCKYARVEDCFWDSYSTWFNDDWTYECPDGNFLTGLKSQHNDEYEDRSWEFRCCRLAPPSQIKDCEWTEYLNNYDGVLDFVAFRGNSIMGIASKYSDRQKDRIFKLKLCFFRQWTQ